MIINQKSIIALLLFIVFGFGVMILGVYLIIENENFKKTSIATKAIVTNIDDSATADDSSKYDVYVKFFVNETEYSGIIKNFSGRTNKGDYVKIRYNPNEPQDIRSGDISHTGVMMLPFGAVFFIIGVFFSYKYKRIRDGKPSLIRFE